MKSGNGDCQNTADDGNIGNPNNCYSDCLPGHVAADTYQFVPADVSNGNHACLSHFHMHEAKPAKTWLRKPTKPVQIVFYACLS